MAGVSSERSFQGPAPMTDSRQGVYILFYDADCRICTAMRNWLVRLGLGRSVRTIPIASGDADPYLGGLSTEERFGRMHVVSSNGERTSGGMAVIRLLEAIPFGLGLSRLLSADRSGVALVDTGYEFLVRLRNQLGH